MTMPFMQVQDMVHQKCELLEVDDHTGDEAADQETESDDDSRQVQSTRGESGSAAGRPGETDEDTDIDDNGELIRKAERQSSSHKPALSGAAKRPAPPLSLAPKPKAPRLTAAAPKERKPRASRSGGAVSLKQLVDEGFLTPGRDNLTCEYKGETRYGSLCEDGSIESQGEVFVSPSAWTIFFKRQLNPDRKADDGWKSIKHEGRLLEYYKQRYISKKVAEVDGKRGSMGTPSHSELSRPSPAPDPSPAPRAPAKRPGPKAKPSTPARPRDRAPGESWGAGAPRQGGAAAAPLPAEVDRRLAEEAKPTEETAPRIVEIGGQRMVQCERYPRGPGKGRSDCQPFTIRVAQSAQFVMDLHSHLSACEVIGLLAGKYDRDRREIRVDCAYPVREAPPEMGSSDAKMSPDDRQRVTSKISGAGMQCVGWYHSHPRSQLVPTVADVESQVLYQQTSRNPDGEEPYVAAILGPYANSSAPRAGSMAWFHVRHPAGRTLGINDRALECGFIPHALEVETGSCQGNFDKDFMRVVYKVIRRFSVKFDSRVEMFDNWRDGLTNLEKMRDSLLSRVPLSWQPDARRAIVKHVVGMVRDAWYPPEDGESGSETDSDGPEPEEPNGASLQANGAASNSDSEKTQ